MKEQVKLWLSPEVARRLRVAAAVRGGQGAQSAIAEEILREAFGMTEKKAPTLSEFVDQLNAYDGDNIWEDVIRHHPDYDDEKTGSADPSYQSDIVALTTGEYIVYDPMTQTWRVQDDPIRR